jgi:hypothetical protein
MRRYNQPHRYCAREGTVLHVVVPPKPFGAVIAKEK